MCIIKNIRMNIRMDMATRMTTSITIITTIILATITRTAPEPSELKGKGWLKRGLAAVIAVGLRPCSGAIFILVFALSQGIFAVGVIATLAMGAWHRDHRDRDRAIGRCSEGGLRYGF